MPRIAEFTGSADTEPVDRSFVVPVAGEQVDRRELGVGGGTRVVLGLLAEPLIV